MKCFLTSSMDIPGREQLNPANGFVDRLKACLPTACTALFICSDPDNPERTDRFALSLKTILEAEEIFFRRFSVLDGRNRAQAGELIRGADFMILAGGHVPTQNRFFAQIGLKELLRGFDGVLAGISAGSMNCAELVYAQPEHEGEAIDPDYRRFLPGLGLTKRMILPHYQAIKDNVLDGLRVMEDIAYPDSMGRELTLLPDGSYLYIDGSEEEICGEAYLLADGKLQRIDGDSAEKQSRVIFESENIRYVEVTEALVPDYLAMVNDIERVGRWIGNRTEPVTEAKEIAWVRSKREEKAALFSMIEKDGGAFIGNIELMDVKDGEAELGVAITAAKQNMGHGKEAVASVAAYAMRELGLRRVFLKVYPENERAIHVYEACGFREYARSGEDVFMEVWADGRHAE